ARERIVVDMEAAGLLVTIDEHTHMVPYGDRGGVPIEPYLTEQWYADAKTLAEPAIKAVEDGRTKFVPENWTKTYYEWMRNIQPWCISRQLWWGHQIPAWYGPDGAIFVAHDEDAARVKAKAHYGEDVALERDPDVLDTWFSSALWPFSTLGWPEDTPELRRYYPTDVLVTGFDIIFFWVARMMMMGLHFMEEVPFHTVYIHALVRDEKGAKMSKSKGNIIDPLELIDEYGADALRFTLCAMAAPGRDIKLSKQRIEGYRNFTTKLWNAARYCQMNDCVPDSTFDPASCKETGNRWIVGEMAKLRSQLENAMASYRFNDAAQAAYQSVWNVFCDWYLEFTKPILNGSDEAAMAETRAATGWALDQLLIMLHPIMPFVTEELWQELDGNRETQLIRAGWPQYGDEAIDGEASAEMDWIVRLISLIRTIRSEVNVPAAAKITALLRDCNQQEQGRLARHRDLVLRLARLDTIGFSEETPKGSAQAVLDNATLILPLEGVIDIAAEVARLNKEIAKAGGEMKGFEKKLSNEKFLANAPEEVIEENRERLAGHAQHRDRLLDALARLQAS
ncbi:MAG: valine--tRNA ligase, partial [Rhodospirillaceae bacterium]|nr:valine--tRNA ligase [Rhodospirillaceae bacterium]